jgi:hypothetical protein
LAICCLETIAPRLFYFTHFKSPERTPKPKMVDRPHPLHTLTHSQLLLSLLLGRRQGQEGNQAVQEERLALRARWPPGTGRGSPAVQRRAHGCALQAAFHPQWLETSVEATPRRAPAPQPGAALTPASAWLRCAWLCGLRAATGLRRGAAPLTEVASVLLPPCRPWASFCRSLARTVPWRPRLCPTL